jgi:pyruvate dehydrogenase E1 component
MSNSTTKTKEMLDVEALETQEWLESMDYVLQHSGPERVQNLLQQLQLHAYEQGVRLPFSANTPYINTIPAEAQPPYPGNREIERRIKSLIRWNAMAMVVRANITSPGIGGHISSCTRRNLMKWALPTFKGRTGSRQRQIYFSYASPGIMPRLLEAGCRKKSWSTSGRNCDHPVACRRIPTPG